MERFFILGNPRSGTSLLRLILNAHPRVVAPPESGFLHWWWNKYQHWSSVDYSAFLDDILSSKKIENWQLSKEGLLALFHQKKPSSYAEAISLVYEAYGIKSSKEGVEVIVDKNNYYIHHIDELAAIWPKARYIHLIRDGRDVACSYLDLQKLKSDSPYRPVLPGSVEEIAKEWKQNNEKIEEALHRLNRPYISVRYEDVTGNPQGALEALMDFLGLPFSEEMLKFNVYNDEPSSTLDWKKLTKSPITSSQSGRFKKLLSASEIETFESIAEDILTKYHYPLISKR